MLYFDQSEAERSQPIRQNIWTILHFPLHMGIILVMEGVSQLMAWVNGLNTVTRVIIELGVQSEELVANGTSGEILSMALNDTIWAT